HHPAIGLNLYNLFLDRYLLSCADVVDMLVAQLPVKIHGREDLVRIIAERHARRQSARDSAYRRQPPAPKNAIRIC
ncbi:MAG: hypothetical protein ABTS16_18000, partial [Candidatus Accumulibacter phosphatis]